MSIQVKSIDVSSIHDRLRKDKTKEGKEVWDYVKQLNEALRMQQELTQQAIAKIRELSFTKSDAVAFQNWIDQNGYYHYTSNDSKWYEYDGELIANDTSELYQLFIKSNLNKPC